ncbi:MAG TPA: FkbM family methyltransferase, partial [Bacteroidia bacterium]|nr:FkbM family methyltransferase [Bacteroidia bacterium]
GMLVFDVGANLGNYTQLFLDKKTKVIAVEPQTYCNDFLHLRFGKNKNVTLLKCGLGSTEEEKELLVSSAHTLSSFNSDWVKGVNVTERFKASNVNWEKKETIPMKTLEGLIREYGVPDYLKIDVEGYETEVLKGLRQKIAMVSYEFTIPELSDDAILCARLLSEIAPYEFLSILDESRSGNWISLENIIKEILQLKNSNKLHGGDIFARLVKHQ